MATVEMNVQPEDLTSVPQTHERIPDPGIMVIFGASGDLTKRKLLPALFHLEQANLLPKNFAIVGVARRALGDEFAKDMRAGIVESGVDNNDPKLEAFAKKIFYYPLSFDDASHYAGLKAELDKIAQEHGIGPDRLFYLATAPEYFAPIVENLGAQGMAQPEHGRAGVVIEKPFGHDLESAKALNHDVNAKFHESQVFRIDHYLGKETVQNILVFRFANGIFEPIWNRNYIDSIQITAAETLGVEGRGPFYEKAGALRDVIQNHVMELLSFVAMEPPSSFDAEAVRSEKVKAWRAIPSIPILNTVLGQYGPGVIDGKKVIGYRDEERVNPESGTETYAGVRSGDRELALGRRALLSARRQAHEEARDGDQHPVQATALADLQPDAISRAMPGDSAEPAHHSHSARRWHCAALRRQSAQHAQYVGLPGEYGLQLRDGLRQVERQRLRAAAAGCDARRSDAVRPPRRRGDDLGSIYADSRGMGREASRDIPKLLRRFMGTGLRRSAAGKERA